jgi:hypothetical protein
VELHCWVKRITRFKKLFKSAIQEKGNMSRFSKVKDAGMRLNSECLVMNSGTKSFWSHTQNLVQLHDNLNDNNSSHPWIMSNVTDHADSYLKSYGCLVTIHRESVLPWKYHIRYLITKTSSMQLCRLLSDRKI